MKIVIAHASAGTGHLKAAEALYRCLKDNHPEVEAEIIDILVNSNPIFRFVYRFGYSSLVKYAPRLWSLAFQITRIRLLLQLAKKLNLVIDRLSIANFAKFLIRENPDVIVSTHFAPPEIAAYLKKTAKIKSRLITVITDFGVHPFWLTDGTDMYVAASDFTKRQLLAEGISENAIRVLGIPIDAKFLRQYSREELCRKLNLDKNKFTVLIATGSFGIGPLEEVIALLYKEVQLLVVCANNKELYRNLKARNYRGVYVYGFIDNMQELMAVSEVIIGKPGGLTISEGLAMNLFPVFITAIPGQESENVKALAAGGVGIYTTDTHRIREIVLDLKNNPEKLNKIKENIKKIQRPDAAREICNVVCQGSIRPSD